MKGGGFIRTESINISAFRQFCDSQFSLREKAKKIKDSRQKPQITTRQIYESVLLGGIFGKGSFLQLDQFLRTPEVKKFIGTDRSQVASDTEILRVLALMEEVALQELNWSIYLRAKQHGLLHLKNPLLEGLKVGLIDGSCFGLFWASGFQLLGNPSIMLDFEPYAKRGKELPASTRLVKRLIKRFGKRFIDLLLVDGLYVSQHFVNSCLIANIDILIKTEEARLNIIEDAEGLFNRWEEYKSDVEYLSGVDENRGKKYEVWCAGGFWLAGVDQPFKVARVKEEDLKTGEVVTYWILTTLINLTTRQMLELVHRRWCIENNGFKQLNEQVKSKRIWTHDEAVWSRLFWIFFMAFNLIGLFEGWLKKNGLKIARLTRGYVRNLLLYSLIREYALPGAIFN